MQLLGRVVIGVGIVLIIAGAVIMLVGKMGPMPGDFSFKRGNLRVYIPLGTSILLSLIVTIVLNLLLRR